MKYHGQERTPSPPNSVRRFQRSQRDQTMQIHAMCEMVSRGGRLGPWASANKRVQVTVLDSGYGNEGMKECGGQG